MLDLLMGGQMMSGLDAIDFMERLADMFDEDVRTEEFCDEYEFALNRFRYEVRKSVPVPVRVTKVRFTSYSCGQCGHGVGPEYKFCSNCGGNVLRHWYFDEYQYTPYCPHCGEQMKAVLIDKDEPEGD